MENIKKYQKQLLEQTQSLYRDTPISEATEQAYLATPRHCFVRRYGNTKAQERLWQRLHYWIEAGMPTAACLNLKVYPIGAQVRTGHNQWLVKRRDSQFLWSLQP